MIKLTIVEINGYNYFLKDSFDNVYRFNIEFYGLKDNPKEDDYMFVDESLLKENNSMISFGPLGGIYGRKIKDSNDKDLIVLVVSGKKFYLKRYYG